MKRGLATLLCIASSPLLAGEDTGARFTRYAGFELDRSTFADVQRALGESPLLERGDAGDYDARLCYRTAQGAVWFVSGEMGGGTTVLGIDLDASNEATACPTPKRALPRGIAGLALGMDKRSFRQAAGIDVAWHDDIGSFRFESRRAATDGTVFDVDVGITGHFTAGRLVRLEVWKVESN